MSVVLSNSVSDFKTNIKFVVSAVEKLRNDDSSEVRVASIHSSTLLIASLFEVFIRTIAKEYLKLKIPSNQTIREVPKELLVKLCEETLRFAKNDFGKVKQSSSEYPKVITELSMKIKDLFEFFEGNFDKDMYGGVVHNERNMSESQLNEIFKVCGINVVCSKVGYEGSEIKKLYPAAENYGTYDQLRKHLGNFIQLRNKIAHKFNLRFAERYEGFYQDCEMLIAFAVDLENLLQIELLESS